MAGNIYEALSKSQGKGGKLGYTLTTNMSILDSILAAKDRIGEKGRASTSVVSYSNTSTESGGGGSSSGGSTTLYAGTVGKELEGYYDGQGFVINGYKAQTVVKAYGSFVVGQDYNGKMKYGLVSVPVGDQNMQNGIDITGEVVYLSNDTMEYDRYKGSNNFVYGVAADVDKFILLFFKKYFPNVAWSALKIKALMSKRAVIAKISVGGVDIIAPVTVHVASPNGVAQTVLIPFVLLLSNSFNKVTSVYVSVNDKNETVGAGTVSNPFSAITYDSSSGKVSFGASDVQQLLTDGGGLPVQFIGSSLSQKNGDTKASVSFFLNENEKQTIENTLGSIPKDYENYLYNKVETNVIPKGDLSESSDLSIACQKLSERLHNKLNIKLVEKAERQVAEFESSGAWNAWNKQDCQEGASIGRHQMSSKAGNVYTYLLNYKSLGGEVSDGFMKEAKRCADIGKDASSKKVYSSVYVNGEKMLQFQSEFNRQCKTAEGKNAQLMTFFEGEKGKFVVKWYNKLKCETALELSSIIGAVNHWPYGMDMLYGYYEDEIMSAKSSSEKAELLERCHMMANLKRKWVKKELSKYYDKDGLMKINVNNPSLAKWRYRHNSMLNWARKGNVNNW